MKLDNMKLKGNEIAMRSGNELVEKPSVLKKLNTVYDEHAKLVFLFDVSGSMMSLIARTFTDQYNWTPEIVAKIKADVSAAVTKANSLMMGVGTDLLTEVETKLIQMSDKFRGPNNTFTFTPKDDEELAERVVRNDLIGHFGVDINWERHSDKPLKRIELVKTLAKSELENRFKKYPNSRVAVIPFGSFPDVMFNDGEPADLWPKLDELCIGWGNAGGGTDILNAISAAMDVCREKPSPVGIHHFIVVSDGEDGRADQALPSWLPSLQASGIVMDYIHIGDETRNAGLELVCKSTGGECVTVNNEKDMRAKFVEAVNRLMLPPAPDKK